MATVTSKLDLKMFFGKKDSPPSVVRIAKNAALHSSTTPRGRFESPPPSKRAISHKTGNKITRKKTPESSPKLRGQQDSISSESTSLSSAVSNLESATRSAKSHNAPEDIPSTTSRPLGRISSGGETDDAESSDVVSVSNQSSSVSDLMVSTKYSVTRFSSFSAPNAASSLESSSETSEADLGDDEGGNIEVVVSANAKRFVPVQRRASVITGDKNAKVKPKLSNSPSELRRVQLATLDESPREKTIKANTSSQAMQSLENFEQLVTLGYGSYGCVHKVRNSVDGRLYACKVLSKAKVLEKRQLIHLKNEKNILMSLSSPFIIQMYSSYIDDKNVYMILELCEGGDLFSLLSRHGRLPASDAVFYASEVVLALEYLHSFNIAYRDLKPENVLLTRTGHVKLCDLGFAKRVDDRTWTLCGTPEYLAPEVIHGLGHGKAVDWWSLGVLIYEMVAGFPPFTGEQQFQMFEKICDLRYTFPPFFDTLTKDIISKFLVKQPTLRLGIMGGVSAIKNHGFFADIDWLFLSKLYVEPPFTPDVMRPKPDSYFRQHLPGFDALCLDVARPNYTPKESDPFAEFDFSFDE